MGQKECAYCLKAGGTYSLVCLGCVRRLWKNSTPANREGILSMVEAFGSQDIADKIRSGTTTKGKPTGNGTTGD